VGKGYILCHGQIIFSQSCLPTLPAYFPLKFPYGQFPPKIPGPVSQTKYKKKKKKKKKKKLMARCDFNKKNKPAFG
jgi:hypothetical protein